MDLELEHRADSETGDWAHTANMDERVVSFYEGALDRVTTPISTRPRHAVADTFAGTSVIAFEGTTVVVPIGQTAVVDRFRSLVAEV